MGFGALALADLLHSDGLASESPGTLHIPPRAKSIIFLYMDGGVSQVDTFDPKPRLAEEDGEEPGFKIDPTTSNETVLLGARRAA